MPTIDDLSALEILDSRGRPTVCGDLPACQRGAASASVPSGASTGAAEALELRDGDPARYGGLGCRKAVAHINGEIHRSPAGPAFADQAELDDALIALDGTPNKSRLGANAILAVSLAFARAQPAERGMPLYRHFAEMLGQPITAPAAHDHQPVQRRQARRRAGGHPGRADRSRLGCQDRRRPGDGQRRLSGGRAADPGQVRMRWLTADEGGLAPPAADPEELFADAVEAIRAAGCRPGGDVCLALDVASSHFWHDGAIASMASRSTAGR